MCCALLIATGLGPRLALVLVWIFGERVEHAFDGWILPLLGLIFLPWTTLMYILVWGPGGLEAWEWLVVALGVFLDVATYGARNAKARYGSSSAY
jgi:hypothetical protein